MNEEYLAGLDARRLAAIQELSTLVMRQYPSAIIQVGPAEEDPQVTHITAMVDIDDPDEVADLVLDRMLQLQWDQKIPVYVIPIRTPERVAVLRQQQRQARRAGPVLPLPPAAHG